MSYRMILSRFYFIYLKVYYSTVKLKFKVKVQYNLNSEHPFVPVKTASSANVCV